MSRPVESAKRAAAEKRTVEPGDVINGKYRVEEVIGEGAVGTVFSARNIELDERVALKFLKPEMLAQPDVVARFLREAKAACSIKSEYVATVYDVGTLPSGAPFIVIEYLEGKDLGSVVQQRGSLGYRETTEYMMQVCEALAVAHAKGVVHRDIKPENLFLTSRAGMNVVKVLDFGISKAALTGSIFGSAVPLVKTASMMGTPLYMAPEQVRSAEDVDERSDIWSLGMVLYELLTGTTAFETTNITELCAMILEAPAQPITDHRKDLPTGYVAIIEKCLEKDPSRRYQNVAELAVALMPFAPRRARICAERATTALCAAGMMEESSVRFPTSVPPPSPGQASWAPLPSDPLVPSVSGERPIYRDDSAPPSASAPVSTPVAPASAPVITASSTVVSAAASAPSLPEPAANDVTPPPAEVRPAKRPIALILAFVAVAAAAAGIATLASRGSAQPAAASPVTTTVVANAQPANTQPANTQPANAQPANTQGATSQGVASPAETTQAPPPVQAAAAPAQPKKAGPVFTWPPPKAAATPTPAAKPTASGAKKSSEEPDLGY
ncbi:MAG: protein kinase [Deltaproteobacteria bacterium]|nr:protein kinase [Deltaproteobacteria bacterium]